MCIYFIQFEDKKIKNLQYAFEKYANKTSSLSFICILSKGERICSELKSIGLNAFNISWDGKTPQTNVIPKLLFSLDLLLQKGNSKEFATYICSESTSYKPKGNIVLVILEEYVVTKLSMNCLNSMSV